MKTQLTVLGLSAAGGLLAASALGVACAETTRYRVLSFFIDGVPPPGTTPGLRESASGQAQSLDPTQTAGGPERRPSRWQIVHFHPPYRKNRCSECHNRDTGQLVQPPEEGLCRTCHTDIPGDARYVHGPVAVDACVFCHHHHQSIHPKLLLRDVMSICYRCHQAEDLTRGEHHNTVGRPDGGPCIDCHSPHGGDDRFFLKRSER